MEAFVLVWGSSGNLTISPFQWPGKNSRTQYSQKTEEDLPSHNDGVVTTIPKFVFVYCLKAEVNKIFSQIASESLFSQFVHKIPNLRALENSVL